MAERPPNLWNIPAGVPFVDVVAHGVLLEHAAEDPLALAQVTILLPTRRAVRALRDAFLRASGGRPLLLPLMRPIGDVDADALALGPGAGEDYADAELLDLPPPISPLRRQLLLARLVRAWGEQRDVPYVPAQAARLAAELARFLDQAHTEQLDFAALDGLVPEALAAHWQDTLEFLRIVTGAWPEILQQEGAIDPADHRNRMLGALAARWGTYPPDGPVIAAGSTGSIPATANLLGVIAGMPDGMVLLPGLDRTLDDASWRQLDPGHPQFGISRLLARLGVTREAVSEWPAAISFPRNEARNRFLSEALRPAETTELWRDADAALRAGLASALEGLSCIEAPAEREESAAIALAMRGVLETPGKTAALVTPDRGLARRVAAELGRWNITVDDSAGEPLADTMPMAFIRLLADMVFREFAPVAFLAACKHPLAACGMSPGTFRAHARAFERAYLRGPRPSGGIGGLRALLAADGASDAARAFLDRIADIVAPLTDMVVSGSLSLYVDALLEVAEGFAASDGETGAQRLWRGEAGEAAAAFFADLRDNCDAIDAVPMEHCPELLHALMDGRAVRPRYGLHPRLSIWGPLEARLQRADLMILSGLNEDSWPATANTDPWLSRPMRARFGLPAPEQRIGLSAHDFVQAAAGPEVLLTRSRKAAGAPTIASRWWLRIENLLTGLGAVSDLAPDQPWLAWAMQLDDAGHPQPELPPTPRPPVPLRPRRLSVSDVETLVRDPYAIYAKHVLGLQVLDPLDAELGASERGIVIHRILEEFLRTQAGPLEITDLSRLREIGERLFAEALTRPGIRAFWKPRFDEIADWFIRWDMAHRARGASPVGLEVTGEAAFQAPAGRFVLHARADRVDRFTDGRLGVYDYKTGHNPAPRQIKAGFAPQLPLEGAIAVYGQFSEIQQGAVRELMLLRIRGVDPPGRADPVPTELIDDAWEGLQRSIANFDDPKTPYVSRRAPMFLNNVGPYDHLARVREWSASGSEES